MEPQLTRVMFARVAWKTKNPSSLPSSFQETAESTSNCVEGVNDFWVKTMARNACKEKKLWERKGTEEETQGRKKTGAQVTDWIAPASCNLQASADATISRQRGRLVAGAAGRYPVSTQVYLS